MGTINQNFPLWELGAVLYWKSTAASVVQTPGGVGVVPAYVMSDGTAQGSNYYFYDQGLGAYKKVIWNDPGQPTMPRNGYFNNSRTSYLRTTQNSTRGFSIQAGLTSTTTNAVPSDYIMDPVSNTSWLTNKWQLSNSSGASKYAEQGHWTTTTGKKGFGVLAKRADGNPVTASDIVLWISVAAPSGGAAVNLSTGTLYRKCRSDGWYEVVCQTSNAATDLYFSIEIPDLVTNLEVEFPCVEGIGTGIDCVSFNSMPTSTSTHTKRIPQVAVARQDSVGTGLENWPEHGWMAAAIVPPFDATNFIIPARRIVSWDDGTAGPQNRINLYVSSSNESAGSTETSGGTDYWSMASATYAFQLGVSYGVVVTWGRRVSTSTALLFINGEYVTSDTVYTLPVGTPPATIRIGAEILYDLPANLWVQRVAIGRNYLSRQECRALSVWFKNRAQNPYS
jgi:hypothetical protein